MPSRALSRRKLISRGAAATAAGIGAASILHWPADAAEFSYKLGSSSPMEHPAMARSAEAAKKIKEQTNGRLEITLYPNSVLGGVSGLRFHPAAVRAPPFSSYRFDASAIYLLRDAG